MKSTGALNWIKKNSRCQKANIVWLVLANAFFSALMIAFAYAVKVVIDGAVKQDKDKLIIGCIVIFAIIVLQFVFRLIVQGLAEHIKAKLEISYRTSVFNALLKKKYQDVTAFHSGELMNRLTSDVAVVADGVSTIIPTVIGSVVRLLLAVVVLCFIDWIFAIAFVVAGLMVFLVMALLKNKMKSLHKKTQETDGKTRSFMQESIENILAIKVFNAGEKTNAVVSDLQEKNFKVKMQRRNYSIFGHSTYNFIFSAGYIFALIFGGVKLFMGVVGFGYGDLSAILQLVNSVQVPFATLSGVMPKLYATTASAERLLEIENLKDDDLENLVDPNKTYQDLLSISAKDLCFGYGDRELVYQNASMQIKKGQSLAITGASGIGKSTIMKLLLGVYPISSGELYLECNGNKIAVGENTRSLFSYVPQGNMLFSGTIKDNVTFVNTNATDEEIEFALKVSMADQFVSELPNGLQTVVGENGIGLSEGQVQRLAIARAVLCKAPIMLLDEATGSLDEQTEKQVISNLLSLKDTTIILVSHRNTATLACDRIIKVDNKKFEEVKNIDKKQD